MVKGCEVGDRGRAPAKDDWDSWCVIAEGVVVDLVLEGASLPKFRSDPEYCSIVDSTC